MYNLKLIADTLDNEANTILANIRQRRLSAGAKEECAAIAVVARQAAAELRQPGISADEALELLTDYCKMGRPASGA